MSENKKHDYLADDAAKQTNGENDAPQNKNNFWIAVVCCALGGLFFGLSFTVMGVYALFSSMILELAAVSFLNAQKRHGYFLACKILRVVSYVIMAVGVGFVIGIIGMKM